MRNLFLCCSAILYLALSSCTDIKYKEPLPHGAPEQQTLPDNLLGMYEIADTEAQKTILSIVQVSAQKWALQQQTAVPKTSVDGQSFWVRNDSLFEKNEGNWIFQQNCYSFGAYYLCKNLETTFIFDLKNGLFLEAGDKEAEPLKLQVRSKGTDYYFNVLEGGVVLYALEPTKQGLRLCYLSNLTKEAKSDLSKLPFKVDVKLHRSESGTQDTIRTANPSNAELTKFMQDRSLYEYYNLIRIED